MKEQGITHLDVSGIDLETAASSAQMAPSVVIDFGG